MGNKKKLKSCGIRPERVQIEPNVRYDGFAATPPEPIRRHAAERAASQVHRP